MYTKLKQLIAATLSVFLLGTMSPTTAFAADHTSIKPTQNDSILLNTNNSEVGIESQLPSIKLLLHGNLDAFI